MALTRECGSASCEAMGNSAKRNSAKRISAKNGSAGTSCARLLRHGARVAGLALVLALPMLATDVAAASPDATNAGTARLALLPPLVGALEGVRRHDHAGVALEGFDPVTYFLGASPRPGDALHEAVWNGHAWRFSSAANRAAFLSRPDVYAPRLGGNDALAMTEGRMVEAQARIAAIVDGRLYLFHTRAARDAFLDDPDAAARAERVWRESRERLARL